MNRWILILGVCLVLALAALAWLVLPGVLPEGPEPARSSPGDRSGSPGGLAAAGLVKRAEPVLPGAWTAPASAANLAPAEPGRGPATAAAVHEAEVRALPADVLEKVKRFEDAAVPIEKRRAELAELAGTGGASAAAVLMALGRERTYLNYAAVEALGGVKADGVAEYLRSMLGDADPRVLSAAAKSLAKQQGEAAVPAIATVVKTNRQRPDGFQDMVCAACVQALADTRSAKAIPVLETELKETVGVTLQHEYGSQIVKALAALQDVAARPVLLAYADRLSQVLNKAGENPMGQRYME